MNASPADVPIKCYIYYNSFFLFLYLHLFGLLSQQPNFKQKFVALLKRFKVTDEVSYNFCCSGCGTKKRFAVFLPAFSSGISQRHCYVVSG